MDAESSSNSGAVNAATLALAGVVFLFLYYFMNQKPKHKGTLPPGPKPLPLFGNLLDIKRSDKNGPGILDKWAEEFGPIYSLRFGAYDGVVLNTADLIKDVFVKHGVDSAGRSNNVFFIRKIIGKYGIGMNDGQEWKNLRRTALHSLRDFGMGKKSLELRIQEEASALVDVIDQTGERPFDPRFALNNATSNVICSIVFGERYDYDNEDFKQLLNHINMLIAGGGFKNPELFVPILTPLIPVLNKTFFQTFKSDQVLRHQVKTNIQKHREMFDPDDVKSFIDVYLKAEIDGELDDLNLEQNMLASIFELFVAGSETSSTTLRWALLYLVNYPEVQAKCQQTIAKELGPVKLPTNTDRDRLPYVEATINEIQRICSIAAYGVMHRAMADIEVAGYTIPKDHLIVSNIYHVHMDPEYWGDPKVFRPERWLGDDGKLLKHEPYLPFSLGPRECPGKNLALQEIFIMLVALLQKFTFKALDPDNPPKISGQMGLAHVPNAFETVASRC